MLLQYYFEYKILLERTGGKADPAPVEVKVVKPKMSKTEQLYERIHLRDLDLVYKFEGITLHMSNGHSYCPDWYVVRCGNVELHEVKGSYKLPSYSRAKLAFDQCKQEFPEFKFVWATKNQYGGFDIQ